MKSSTHRRQHDRSGSLLIRRAGAATLCALLLAGASFTIHSGDAGGEVLVGYGSNAGGPAGHRPASLSRHPESRISRRVFSISGDVAGLFPGAAVLLPLKVTNLKRFSITVTSIVTVVEKASASCSASTVQVAPFTGTLHLPPKGTATTTVVVMMHDDAPDACQGVHFAFHYQGWATK
jgi:hypothetical protein